MPALVDVYEFLASDGLAVGCGTKVEFDYWTAEGVFEAGGKLGRIITREPASEDARRRKAWGVA